MNIVIVGSGKVGSTLTQLLSGFGHSVTIVDTNPAVMKSISEEYDVIGIVGNGASYKIQREAGVETADLLIAATPTDEINMVACLLAKKLGCTNTIARIRNPEYNQQLRLLQEDLGLSLIINPELSAAQEIVGLIGFPGADSIFSLSGGRVNIVRYTVEGGSPLVDKPLFQLAYRRGENVLVCAVERGGEVYIPRGDFVVQAGDHLHLAGALPNVDMFLRRMGEHKHVIRSVLLVGGGKVAYYVAAMLEGTRIQVKILEKNEARCRELAETLAEALVLHADGSEQRVLDEEGINDTDAIVALTGMDEENLIISMYGILKNVPKIITKINRMEYISIVERIGLDSVISPKQAAVNQIARYVRAMRSAGGEINALYRLVDGKAEVLEISVSETVRHAGEPLRQLPIRRDVLLVCIIRDNKVFFPGGDDSFAVGDRVVLITTTQGLADMNDIYE